MKLSIIIVNYNVTDYLRACLLSIERYIQNIAYEVVVVDNCSTDTSWQDLKAEFPKVKFIALSKNLGFSGGNNRAISHAQGEYILLLNPDTEFQSFGFEKLISFAESKSDFGSLGVRMYDYTGSFLPESKRSVPDMINSFKKLFLPYRNKKVKDYYRNDLEETAIAEVEIMTGAFLLMKKQVYLQIGGLDERYFMYGEDIDLCYTLLQNGFVNYYYGAFSILHHKGKSTVKDVKYLDNFYGAMQVFLEKYYKNQPIRYFVLTQGLKVKYWSERIKLWIKNK